MTKLVVIEPEGTEIAGKIIEGLHEYGGTADDVGICRFETLGALCGISPDVLIIAPDITGEQALKAASDKRVACGIALVPGDTGTAVCEAMMKQIDAGCVVTYGISPKNTITLSSISEEKCVLAIQRELVTASGDVLDRQEIRIHGGMRPDALMATAGTLIICGVKLPDINT